MELGSVFEKIKEQEFYQQGQNLFQQLPRETQNYIKWGSVGAGFVLLFYFMFSVMFAANTAKSEYYEKQDLTQAINSASDELRRLKGQSSGISQAGDQNWKTILGGMIAQQGLAGDALEIIKETPGASQSMIQETFLEVKVKGISLRPLVQLLYQIDHGSTPMKLKGLVVEPGASEGLLNAKLNLSGYLGKPEKSEKSK